MIREQYGFDRPLPERYVRWLGDVARGDLGRSVRTNQPVSESLRERLPVTLQLAVMAELIAAAIAVPLATNCALRSGGRLDRVTTNVMFAMSSFPTFIVSIALVWVFALKLSWLPVTGFERLDDGVADNLRHALLPALALASAEIAALTTLLRASLTATLDTEFIAAARSRGLPPRHILHREALRPSAAPFVTLTGTNVGQLIGGAFIVEYYFGIGGIGTLAIHAVGSRDFPVLQGCVLVVVAAVVVAGLLVDISYRYLDPRIRAG
jgi:peptide/nickel transport system permease protein